LPIENLYRKSDILSVYSLSLEFSTVASYDP
jgi:hypothetical protein